MKAHEFIEEFLPIAVEAGRRFKVPAGVLLAMAMHESAYGRSGLAVNANNYFGVKAHAPFERAVYKTWEYYNGQKQRVNAAFAKYKTPQDSFMDAARILTGRLYAKAVKELRKNNVVGFVTELGKVWATDPRYAEKILAIMNRYGLWKIEE